MLCYEFPPIGGGGAGVVYGLSRQLVKEGHDVDVVTMAYQNLPKKETVEGVSVYRVPCIRRQKSNCSVLEAASYLLSVGPTVNRLVKQNRYDINHTHFIFPDGVIAQRLYRKFGLPYIITAHGSDVPGYNPERLKWLHPLLQPIWKRVVQGAQAVVCPSKTLQTLIQQTHSGSDNTTIIPNGIDVSHFSISDQSAKRILVVTRMIERKGVQYVLRALEGLMIDHELHVVGDGPYLPQLKEQAEATGAKVKFWGWVDNKSDDLKKLYANARIFVLPSSTENFPMVLLEAMASGLAVITTEGTGCAEVVEDTGILVPAKDAEAIRYMLEKLTQDASLCQSMGQAARRRIEQQFDWPSVSKRYVDLYRQTLDGIVNAQK